MKKKFTVLDKITPKQRVKDIARAKKELAKIIPLEKWIATKSRSETQIEIYKSLINEWEMILSGERTLARHIISTTVNGVTTIKMR